MQQNLCFLQTNSHQHTLDDLGQCALTLPNARAAGKQEARFSMETFNESTARLRGYHVS